MVYRQTAVLGKQTPLRDASSYAPHPFVCMHNVEIISTMPRDRGVLYPVLPTWWDEYECLYLLIVYTALVSLYYCSLFLRGVTDHIRPLLTLKIS